MSRIVFSRLSGCTDGRVILANIYSTLVEDDAYFSVDDVIRFLDDIGRRLDAVDTALHEQFIRAVYHAAWDPDAGLLQRGARIHHDGAVVAFKTYDRVKELLADAAAHPDVASLVPYWKKKPYLTVTDKEGKELASSINDLPSDAPLFLGKRLPRDGARRFAVWYTRKSDCLDKDKGLMAERCPSVVNATNFRNWLGLGDVPKQMPLFAFVSRGPAGGREAHHRPTQFDGIDQKWFKYRRDGVYPPEDIWARATDIPKIGGTGGLDGGPEAIGGAVPVKPDYRCYYVGRVADTVARPGEAYVDKLARPNSAQGLIDQLLSLLWPPQAAFD